MHVKLECRVNANACKCDPDTCLVKPLHWSHGGLDVQGPNVLPMLLQQRDEEVHGKMNVLDEVVFSHADVADGDRQAEHLRKSCKYPDLRV